MTSTTENVDYDLPPDSWDLRDAADRAEKHLDRADTKAPHAFGAASFVGGAVFVAAGQPGTPAWVLVALAAGVGVPVVTAVLLTIAAWLPRLDGGHGFAVYANAAPQDLPQLVLADQTNTVDRLTWTSRRVYRKYALIRAAGQLTAVAVVAAALTGAIALTGHLAG